MTNSIGINHRKWVEGRPVEWKLRRYKEIFEERNDRSETGSEMLLSVSAFTGVSPRSEVVDDIDEQSLSRAKSLIDYKKCYPNDLVINIMLAWNKGLAFTNYEGIVSPAYAVFKVKSDDDSGFLNYLLRDDETNLYFKAYSTGVIDSRLRLYPEVFKSLYCSLPEPKLQKRIASYLDAETAKIDELIHRQEELISLLMEKRQALISNCITKGINNGIHFKESNVEWYGEIPAHWEVTKLKYLLKESLQYGANESGDAGQEGWPRYIRITDIDSDGNLKNESIKTLNPELASPYMLKHGDVLFARSGGTVGKSFIFDGAYGESCFAGYLIKASVNSTRILPEYLKYITESHMYWEYILGTQSQSTIQNVSAEKYARFPIPLPPIAEQHVICKRLDAICRKMNELVGKSKRSVSLLHEHRASLISAAVTGKIDVRELA